MKKIMVLIFILVLFPLLISTPKESSLLAAAETGYRYYFPIIKADAGNANFSSIGPDGGTVVSIEIDPGNPNVLYAGTWGNGIYKSFNQGATWDHKSNGLIAGFIFAIAIDPNNKEHILVSAYMNGAYATYDGGETWVSTYGMPEETVVYAFAFDPLNSNVVYAAVREKTLITPELHYPGGVYKSTNGGRTWVKKSSGLPDDYVYDILIDPNHPNILYTAMHQTGVYKSTNNAESWFSVNNNIHYRDVRSLDIHPQTLTIYAGMYDGKGVAITRNGGSSWTQINSTVSQGIYVYSLKLDDFDFKSLYLTGPGGLFRCAGNPYPSETSTCEKIAHSNQYVYSVALDKASALMDGKINNIYTGLQDYGLNKSINGGVSFYPSYSGIKSNVINSVLNDPMNPSIIYASAIGRGLFKSVDEGQTWEKLTNGVPIGNVNRLIFRPGNSNVVYAATQQEGIFISENAGLSWKQLNSGLSRTESEEVTLNYARSAFDHPAYSWMDPVDIESLRVHDQEAEILERQASYPEILTITINPANTAQMIAGTVSYGILKSDDYGLNWSQTDLRSGNAYDAIIDQSQPYYIYFVGVLDYAIRAADVNRQAWPTRNSGFHSGADVYALTQANPGVYFAATDRGIYLTKNAGISWEKTSFPDILFNDVFSEPNQPDAIWAASSIGLYRSLDSGQQWNIIAHQHLNDRFISISQGYGTYAIYFGMSGGNIYRFDP